MSVYSPDRVDKWSEHLPGLLSGKNLQRHFPQRQQRRNQRPFAFSGCFMTSISPSLSALFVLFTRCLSFPPILHSWVHVGQVLEKLTYNVIIVAAILRKLLEILYISF